ncbi:MAG: pantoate--beta-alanine ligase [Bacteroidota bacterium]
MLLFKKVKDLQSYLETERSRGQSIGFIPTMGALHQGHLSLVQNSLETTDISVVSIFVNPTQFNEQGDLAVYPRTPEKDIDLLVSVGCQVLFMPDVNEVYPDGLEPGLTLEFGDLDKSMEGAHRPGHFEGMAQVVNRLLQIVMPDSLYMGQKDFQQFTIVKEMIRQLKLKVKLVMCPIIRENDGLAMSSRNVRLTKEQRLVATKIYQTLSAAKEKVNQAFPKQIEEEAMEMLAIPGMKPEYFSIVDGETLRPVEVFEDVKLAVACTAVRVGEVRLIDNMILKWKE